MSKPTMKKMLEALDGMEQTYGRGWFWTKEIDAIRSALIERDELKKKVGEWSKKMEKYFVEGRISIPCRAIDWNKMTEFFKEIRDFRLDGEERK